jgi:hypothetical protein
MKNKLILTAIAFLCLMQMVSCKKFVDIPPPKNQLASSKVFADSLDANSAIGGIYIDMYQSFGFSFASGGLTAYPGLSADEFAQTSNDPDLNQLFENRIDIRNGYNSILWSSAYKYIYDANACIEGITNSKIPPTAKLKLIAEARQLRAFVYFNLANLYGSVPLITSTDYHINQSKPRDPIDAAYAQVLNDLTYAQANLPKNNIAERANYYSASALIAKVQLYRKNYGAAETAANAVISTGNYHLENDLNNVFLANSSEAIWKIIPVFQGIETWEGYNFVPSDPTAVPQFVLSSSLYNSFEANDLRKTNWIGSNSTGGSNYPYPFKYKAATTNGNPTESYVIIRLAELYLIRAEARANLADISGAQSDINMVRNRSGLGNTAASDKAALLLAIEKERRAELFCEWGNRWFDLQRTGRADAVLSLVKPNWNHSAILYPIPDAEMKSNPALIQNPGY